MDMNCIYSRAWIGRCNKPAASDTCFCPEHANKKCSSCGTQATRNCDETMGPLVCGGELCDSCEHATAPNGTNQYMEHIPQGTQRFRPWWQLNNEERILGKYLCLLRDIDAVRSYAEACGEGEYTREEGAYLAGEIAKMEVENPQLAARAAAILAGTSDKLRPASAQNVNSPAASSPETVQSPV